MGTIIPGSYYRTKFTAFAHVIQKRPTSSVFRESCSENMQQIYRRTPMPKCDFNKVALQMEKL